VVRAAHERNLRLSTPADVAEVTGQGMRGRVDGREVHVGKAAFAGDPGRAAWAATARRRSDTDGALTVFVGVDGRAVGVLLFDDPVRPDTARTIRSLRRGGVDRIVMATGDRRPAAEAVDAVAGVDEVFAADATQEPVLAAAGLGFAAAVVAVAVAGAALRGRHVREHRLDVHAVAAVGGLAPLLADSAIAHDGSPRMYTGARFALSRQDADAEGDQEADFGGLERDMDQVPPGPRQILAREHPVGAPLSAGRTAASWTPSTAATHAFSVAGPAVASPATAQPTTSSANTTSARLSARKRRRRSNASIQVLSARADSARAPSPTTAPACVSVPEPACTPTSARASRTTHASVSANGSSPTAVSGASIRFNAPCISPTCIGQATPPNSSASSRNGQCRRRRVLSSPRPAPGSGGRSRSLRERGRRPHNRTAGDQRPPGLIGLALRRRSHVQSCRRPRRGGFHPCYVC
jgi:hypothetical protein